MDEEKNKMETLSGRVAEGIPDRFRKTVPHGYKIGHCLGAAAELWIDLPEETRRQILSGQIQGSLVDLVRQIVEERIAAGEAAGRALAERLKRKRGPKG